MAEAKYSDSPLGLTTWANIKNYQNTGEYIDSIFSTTAKLKNNVKPDNPKVTSRINVSSPTTLHTNEIYDVSTENILKTFDSSIPSMSLKAADFAYLRDFGVYPNNRLAIVRRFGGPVPDNLYKVNNIPISTLITYFEDTDFVLDFKVSEEWTDAETSFKEILNQAAKDFRLDKVFSLGDTTAGDYAGGAAGLVPLPGYTQLAQRRILKAIGLISGDDQSILPAGDPNLIRAAKVRKLPEGDGEFQGVSCEFSITLKFVYEQKFISGIDPTIVFYDILNNLLTMGTSETTTYLGKNAKLADTFEQTLDSLSRGLDGIFEIVGKIVNYLKETITGIVDAIGKFFDKKEAATTDSGADDLTATTPTEAEDPLKSLFDFAKGIVDDLIAYVAIRYRLPILGVVSALTGLPSAPWHVTLGNPFKPIFVSGDMLCDSVDIKLGSKLAFNDLPSTIEASISLKSARNLGLQEIMTKFLDGQIRTSNGSYMTLGSQTIYNGQATKSQIDTLFKGASLSRSGAVDLGAVVGSSSTDSQTKVGNNNDEGKQINPDPNTSDNSLINIDKTLNTRSANQSNTPQNSSGQNNTVTTP